MFGGLVARLRALLALPDRVRKDVKGLERAVAKAADRAGKRQGDERRDVTTRLERLERETAALGDELRRGFRQYHVQLGRLTNLLEGRAGPRGRGGREQAPVATMAGRLPLTVDASSDRGAPLHGAPAFDAADWISIDRCPACRTPERTIVCEWNKLVLLETAPDERAWRYDYAVCHGCGILYATERPTGGRYRYLMEHFEDVIDKNASNPLLNPHPLSDDDRVRYRALIGRGVFVSDHQGGEYLDGVFKDRLENAAHVDLLGSMLPLSGARVLEVRSRAGTIVEGLRRLYGCQVMAMPIFESQQFILRELYGIETSAAIDFEHFTIPFDGPFDLIACNHMFNHAVRLDQFLDTVRAALRPGGHLYLYNEIDDSEFLDGNQSMIATMNPLHLQAADRMSLARAVAASGFETVFVKGRQKRNIILARRVDGARWRPMSADERETRIARYEEARDRAVLRAPEAARARLAGAWPATIERAVARGIAVFDDSGAVRLVKSPS